MTLASVFAVLVVFVVVITAIVITAIVITQPDDRAKTPGRRTPTLDYFLLLLESVRVRPHETPRTAIGACDLA